MYFFYTLLSRLCRIACRKMSLGLLEMICDQNLHLHNIDRTPGRICSWLFRFCTPFLLWVRALKWWATRTCIFESQYRSGQICLKFNDSRFVPGESLEMACEREVKEEVGVEVNEVEYIASQPWPMPNQLMLGCIAYTEGMPSIKVLNRGILGQYFNYRWCISGKSVNVILLHDRLHNELKLEHFNDCKLPQIKKSPNRTINKTKKVLLYESNSFRLKKKKHVNFTFNMWHVTILSEIEFWGIIHFGVIHVGREPTWSSSDKIINEQLVNILINSP